MNRKHSQNVWYMCGVRYNWLLRAAKESSDDGLLKRRNW